MWFKVAPKWNRVTMGHCWETNPPLTGGQTYIQNLLAKTRQTPGWEKTSRTVQQVPSGSELNLEPHIYTSEVIGPGWRPTRAECYMNWCAYFSLHSRVTGSRSKLNLQRGRPRDNDHLPKNPHPNIQLPHFKIISLLVSVHAETLSPGGFKCKDVHAGVKWEEALIFNLMLFVKLFVRGLCEGPKTLWRAAASPLQCLSWWIIQTLPRSSPPHPTQNR